MGFTLHGFKNMSKDTLRNIENAKRRWWRIGLGLRDGYWATRLLRYVPMPYLTRVYLDALPKPQYAFGLYSACYQAAALGIPRITVMEFGVATGKGLRHLENHAEKIAEAFSIQVDVVGFDIGSGMKQSDDYRDIGYWFTPSLFAVDAKQVEASLRFSKYIVGDVAETLRQYEPPSPIGFISLDMDAYTPTMEALKLFDLPTQNRLPRTILYLDDVFGISDLTLPCAAVGEQRAIEEFNAQMKGGIYPINGLRHKRTFPAYWNEQMYCYHDIDHPLYNTAVNPLV